LTSPPIPSWREAIVLLAALVAPVLVAAALGAAGPQSLRLNLGPGDGPYVRDFLPDYEVRDYVARHWTTRRAAVVLPLEVRGGPATLVYRYAPPPLVEGDVAEIEVWLAGTLIDRYTAGRVEHQERVVWLGALPPTPLEIRFAVRSRDDRDLGLWLDWLRLDLGVRGRSVLEGAARWRPALLVALLFSLLLAAGWRARAAALLSAPAALLAAAGLRLDPWLVHRLLTGVPEALLAFGLAVALGSWWLRRLGCATDEDARTVSALVLLTFLVRAVALNHPDYYHPDLRSHAQLALLVRRGGLDFWLSPSSHLARLGTWYRPLLGGLTFPYTPAFHWPFALSGMAYDQIITAMKLAAAALSTVPIALAWVLARRLRASPWGALLVLAAPIYGLHLAVAYLPALFGHAFDLAFLCWLAFHRERLRNPAVWVAAAGLVAVCELAYVGGVIVLPMFVLALALAEAFANPREPLRRALAVVGFGAAGSLCAVLVYYRHFAVPVLRGLAQGGLATAPLEPAKGFLEVAGHISRSNFPFPVLALATVGLVFLFRRGKERPLLAAWLSAYGLILLGRSLAPAVFGHQHEALFVAPLVALGAGEALARLGEGSGLRRVLAAAGWVALAIVGLALQWQALMRQTVYAR
jgi:hypothetical protein